MAQLEAFLRGLLFLAHLEAIVLFLLLGFLAQLPILQACFMYLLLLQIDIHFHLLAASLEISGIDFPHLFFRKSRKKFMKAFLITGPGFAHFFLFDPLQDRDFDLFGLFLAQTGFRRRAPQESTTIITTNLETFSYDFFSLNFLIFLIYFYKFLMFIIYGL